MKELERNGGPNEPTSSHIPFKPTSQVKGIRIGGQFIVKSFTIRRARPMELLKVISHPSAIAAGNSWAQPEFLFSSTTVYLPTKFTILAHRAWHTITLGLGTKKSKVLLFVFESETMKWGVEKGWAAEICLGEVNKKLIRGLAGHEMARFKFRKGCITFYVYAVRKEGDIGFSRANELFQLLQSVVGLSDFVDHTAMLAMPHRKTISIDLRRICHSP